MKFFYGVMFGGISTCFGAHKKRVLCQTKREQIPDANPEAVEASCSVDPKEIAE